MRIYFHQCGDNFIECEMLEHVSFINYGMHSWERGISVKKCFFCCSKGKDCFRKSNIFKEKLKRILNRKGRIFSIASRSWENVQVRQSMRKCVLVQREPIEREDSKINCKSDLGEGHVSTPSKILSSSLLPYILLFPLLLRIVL